MADRFFTQTSCDRYGGSLAGGRTMSMFNEQCICMKCKDAEAAAVGRGDYNFAGIGLA